MNTGKEKDLLALPSTLKHELHNLQESFVFQVSLKDHLWGSKSTVNIHPIWISKRKKKKAPLVSLNISKKACEVYLILIYNCIWIEGAL